MRLARGTEVSSARRSRSYEDDSPLTHYLGDFAHATGERRALYPHLVGFGHLARLLRFRHQGPIRRIDQALCCLLRIDAATEFTCEIRLGHEQDIRRCRYASWVSGIPGAHLAEKKRGGSAEAKDDGHALCGHSPRAHCRSCSAVRPSCSTGNEAKDMSTWQSVRWRKKVDATFVISTRRGGRPPPPPELSQPPSIAPEHPQSWVFLPFLAF